MKLLLLLLPVLVFFVALYAGYQAANRENRIPRAERKELNARREFMENLGEKAVEHSMLGDHFAVIALDMLNHYRKENRK